MGLITFKKGHIGANLSAHNSFKSFIIFVFMLLMTTSGVMAEVIDGLNYDLNSETKTATLLPKQDDKYSGDIVVPEKVKGNDGVEYVVTSLGDGCFSYCRDLTSITIPSSVTSLGDGCFSSCRGLTSITIPSSVTSLGDNCFSDCRGLTSITIPSSVTSLGYNCFRECKGLTSVTIPSSVTSLSRGCFCDCHGLTSVTIPSSVTSLGDYCFDSCVRLTSITIPSSVTSLGRGCFSYCIRLASITIPSSVTSLGRGCFDNCRALTSITIPSSVTSLGDECFFSCHGLTSITIPSSVTSLGVRCFFYCTRLPSITIPSSVTSLGEYCFFSCNSLKRMYFEGAKPEKISEASIFEKCRIYVPAEYFQDYKNALGSQYRYIFSWDPNNPETNINQATTRGIVASAHDGIVSISGLDNGEVVKFYAADGKLIGSSSAVDGTASCAVSETMVIAKFGGNAIKVAVK